MWGSTFSDLARKAQEQASALQEQANALSASNPAASLFNLDAMQTEQSEDGGTVVTSANTTTTTEPAPLAVPSSHTAKPAVAPATTASGNDYVLPLDSPTLFDTPTPTPTKTKRIMIPPKEASSVSTASVFASSPLATQSKPSLSIPKPTTTETVADNWDWNEEEDDDNGEEELQTVSAAITTVKLKDEDAPTAAAAPTTIPMPTTTTTTALQKEKIEDSVDDMYDHEHNDDVHSKHTVVEQTPETRTSRSSMEPQKEEQDTSSSSSQDETIRSKILSLLQKHDVSKVDRIDAIMEKFKGRESILMQKMMDRYEKEGSTPSSPEKSNAVPSSSLPESDTRSKEEQKTPPAAADVADANKETTVDDVVVTRDKLLSLFEKYDPTKIDKIDVLMEKFKGRETILLRKMTGRYEKGSAATTTEVKAAIVPKKTNEAETPPLAAATPVDAHKGEEMPDIATETREKILSLFERYDPTKVDRIDAIMDKFKGRESILLQKMMVRYEGATTQKETEATTEPVAPTDTTTTTESKTMTMDVQQEESSPTTGDQSEPVAPMGTATSTDSIVMPMDAQQKRAEQQEVPSVPTPRPVDTSEAVAPTGTSTSESNTNISIDVQEEDMDEKEQFPSLPSPTMDSPERRTEEEDDSEDQHPILSLTLSDVDTFPAAPDGSQDEIVKGFTAVSEASEKLDSFLHSAEAATPQIKTPSESSFTEELRRLPHSEEELRQELFVESVTMQHEVEEEVHETAVEVNVLDQEENESTPLRNEEAETPDEIASSSTVEETIKEELTSPKVPDETESATTEEESRKAPDEGKEEVLPDEHSSGALVEEDVPPDEEKEGVSPHERLSAVSDEEDIPPEDEEEVLSDEQPSSVSAEEQIPPEEEEVLPDELPSGVSAGTMFPPDEQGLQEPIKSPEQELVEEVLPSEPVLQEPRKIPEDEERLLGLQGLGKVLEQEEKLLPETPEETTEEVRPDRQELQESGRVSEDNVEKMMPLTSPNEQEPLPTSEQEVNDQELSDGRESQEPEQDVVSTAFSSLSSVFVSPFATTEEDGKAKSSPLSGDSKTAAVNDLSKQVENDNIEPVAPGEGIGTSNESDEHVEEPAVSGETSKQAVLDKFTSQIQRLEENHRTELRDMEHRHKSELEKAANHDHCVATMKQLDEEFREKLNDKDSQIDGLTQTNEGLTLKIDVLKRELAGTQSILKERESDMGQVSATHNRDLQKIEKKAREMEDQVASNEHEVKRLKDELAASQAELGASNDAYSTLKARVKVVATELKERRVECRTLHGNVSELSTSNESLQTQIENLQSQLSEQEKLHSETNEGMGKLRATIEELEKELSSAKKALEERGAVGEKAVAAYKKKAQTALAAANARVHAASQAKEEAELEARAARATAEEAVERARIAEVNSKNAVEDASVNVRKLEEVNNQLVKKASESTETLKKTQDELQLARNEIEESRSAREKLVNKIDGLGRDLEEERAKSLELKQDLSYERRTANALRDEVETLREEVQKSAAAAFMAGQKDSGTDAGGSSVADGILHSHQNGVKSTGEMSESESTIIMLQQELNGANQAIKELKEALKSTLKHRSKHDADHPEKDHDRDEIGSHKSFDSSVMTGSLDAESAFAGDDHEAGNDSTPLYFAIEKQSELNMARNEINRLANMVGEAESEKMEAYEAMDEMRRKMEEAEARLRRYEKLGPGGGRSAAMPHKVSTANAALAGREGSSSRGVASLEENGDATATATTGNVNLEYLKNVMLSYLNAKSLAERRALVPVLGAVLELTAEEQATALRHVEESGDISGVGHSLMENFETHVRKLL